ncbi:hypothetical protein PLESTB_000104500 [Pleodorina starrii]|uniref:Uncharacterized protein n=1 Tax=Pleodorina starrii TaxID=330485 RepID=A0A9W6BAI8_9CHLO|nr:hypothetical protein PLESTM_000100800 [Pleodorina starrii]GLC48498.1 hypothetical protein PLESTB_000104500 [Pleodorina starrii]GLC71817.1 hypothetical protein PLESTF_001170200 [Pleodorina starrii]
MSYVPKNVRDTAAKNDHYAKLAKEQAQAIHGSVLTHWAERDRKREPVNTLRGATMTLQATKAGERDAGIKAGLATVKAARQARLKELYEREALMYEEELNARGLSLVKPRD